VISFLFNSVTDCSVTELNSEDGFPHSEICGSKVAHTSPQLIAACHVLHRLCMPRHPRIALTSRLRIHIINDKSGTRVVETPGACIKRPSQPPRGAATVTQLDKDCSYAPSRPHDRNAATASISRTHSQCQRWGQIPISAAGAAKSWSSSLEIIKGWWSQPGSNRRPQACKASALPTELWPLAQQIS
jgi:hypothetical protein